MGAPVEKMAMLDYWSSLLLAGKEDGQWWSEFANVPSTVPLWQPLTVTAVIIWLFIARILMLTGLVRRFLQPGIKLLAERGVETVLRVQRYRTPALDKWFSIMAMAVSIEFYISFLPLLVWMNQWKFAMQLCVLMALCLYICNSMKDLVCSPRPSSPPVRRIAFSIAEKVNSVEYGFPSSHSTNVVALALYLFQFCIEVDMFASYHWCQWAMAAALTIVCVSVIYGRIYLGMHTLVDVLGGTIIGLFLPFLFGMVDDHIPEFIARGENVVGFQFCVAFLVLFAYPTPEVCSPSFTDVTAFNGAVFGLMVGLHQTFGIYHFEGSLVLSPTSSGNLLQLLKRVLLGFPIALTLKVVGKAVAIYVLPLLASMAGIPIKSTEYIKFPRTDAMSSKDLHAMSSKLAVEKPSILLNKTEINSVKLVQSKGKTLSFTDSDQVRVNDLQSSGLTFRGPGNLLAEDCDHQDDRLRDYSPVNPAGQNKVKGDNWIRLQRVSFGFSEDDPYDVDTGIRLISYSSLGWSVVVLAPAVFHWLGV